MEDDVLRRWAEPSPFAWWEWDVTADLVDFSDLKVTMLGYRPRQFRGGGYRVFTDLVHPDDLDRTMTAMVRVLDGSEPIYQVDYRIRAQDGRYQWYLDRGLVLGRGASGRPTLLRGIVVDLGPEPRTLGTAQQVVELMERSIRDYTVTGQSSVVLCSCCLQAKVQEKDWIEVSPNLQGLIGREVFHGLCPRCLQTLYPEWAAGVLDRLM